MGEKLTQTMALEVWTLDSPGAMFECFAELVDEGWRGEIKCYPLKVETLKDVPVKPVWFLEVNADDKPSVTATLGQTVVLMGGVLEAMTAEAYTARFG